ncbi:MAG: exosortase-associated EpsI family protein [Limisphaerales bacterium]
MRSSKWVVFGVALGMIAATAGWLREFRGRHLLGAPGVKVGHVPIYDEKTNLVSTQSVVLPAVVLGIPSRPLPVTTSEVNALPKDTTFGRRFYLSPERDFGVQVSVVLMGTDHTSIHQPQYCLYAQDWNVTGTERINLHMDRPMAYDIPAIKLTASRQLQSSGQTLDCIYVYWFVSGDKITAEEGSRLWSMWKTVLRKGELERWAYVSYFVTCLPGAEQATFERLERFIRASAPEFQLVRSQPSGRLSTMASQK